MPTPPEMADGAVVLFAAELEGLLSTHACRFWRDGVPQTGFCGLLIASYLENDQCYLFYCSANWVVENDTDHRNITEAQEFAECLFPGISDRWDKVC